MSVEASEGKIQHQPIYSFTHSPARSGSLPPERSCSSLCCATPKKRSVFTGTHGHLNLEEVVISESNRPEEGESIAVQLIFLPSLSGESPDFLHNHGV